MYRPGWPVFSDHSATQHSIMREEGFNMVNADKADRDLGIQKVQARFNLKGIKISRECPNLIHELFNYTMRPATVNGKEEPDHKFSHAPDALRYGICGIDTQSIFDCAFQ